MPVYDFRCETCKETGCFNRSIAERDEPGMCLCGGVMHRVLSVPQIVIPEAFRTNTEDVFGMCEDNADGSGEGWSRA